MVSSLVNAAPYCMLLFFMLPVYPLYSRQLFMGLISWHYEGTDNCLSAHLWLEQQIV